jgi:hypothetical protein
MDKIKKTSINNSDGLTLIEVTVAVFIFSFFITAFMTGQGNNILSSARMKDDMILKDLAQMQYNLTLLDPPDFSRPVVDGKKETKAFKDYPGYQYTLLYKPVYIPDIDKILGSEGDENDPDKQMRKKIMKEFKDNMEKLVWQISITVMNKATKASFEIAGWTYYPDAKVKFKGL